MFCCVMQRRAKSDQTVGFARAVENQTCHKHMKDLITLVESSKGGILSRTVAGSLLKPFCGAFSYMCTDIHINVPSLSRFVLTQSLPTL